MIPLFRDQLENQVKVVLKNRWSMVHANIEKNGEERESCHKHTHTHTHTLPTSQRERELPQIHKPSVPHLPPLILKLRRRKQNSKSGQHATRTFVQKAMTLHWNAEMIQRLRSRLQAIESKPWPASSRAVWSRCQHRPQASIARPLQVSLNFKRA